MSESDESILAEFLAESHECLGQVESDLLSLERDPSDPKRLASIFRAVHTIKGTCGFFGFVKLEAVAHAGENFLSRLRSGEIRLNPEIADTLLGMVDALRAILASIESGRAEGDGDYAAVIDALARLDRFAEATPSPRPGAAPEPEARADAAPPAGGVPTTVESTIRVDVHLLDVLMNLVGELVLARNQLLQHVASQTFDSVPATTQRLNLITSELQEGIMKTRMQPIANLCGKLPRLVRDVSAACGKEARLEMEGIGTELDRTIIEAIRDPLTHLVRNAIDHGIEAPETRVAAGKLRSGRLLFSAFHEGGKVILEVSDDGGGLPLDRIRDRAIVTGHVTPERADAMSDRDLSQLIFLPGFSTADKVTSVSGRGVGMDVVRTNIERIGGTIEVESQPGQGTHVRIRIPLTLAIIPALIVSAGGDRYAIPQVNLVELLRTEGKDGETTIARVYDAPVYRYRDSLLPLVFLHDALRLGGPIQAGLAAEGDTALHIVVLQADGIPFGLVVDDIQDSQEIVVKPLTEAVKNTAIFSGATILGDGRVALILDVPGLARHAGIARVVPPEAAVAPDPVAAPLGALQTLVLLRLAEDWRAAVPLAAVARLEEIPRSAVERAGDREVVQYRGGVLRLTRLLDLLEPGEDHRSDETERLRVVVCEGSGAPVGLVVEEVLEIVEETLLLQPAAGRSGILGTAVIRDRITDLIDLPALLATGTGA
jgi:two-component system chemotaxis sensor kinase CheA